MFLFCNFLSFCEKHPHENRKLCCVWLLITFAFACVLIHGLHLKWSLRSSCLTTFGMFPLVISSTDICSNLHTKLFRGQAREGEGKERDTLSYPGFMLHPRLPNLQQLFLKRNHRISTSRNTSSLSYPDIVLYLIPHFFVYIG